ncbi:OstA-like protein [Marinoscillum pacificum]|uniref:OstA-like protein n=1 Tax=Marinoscillum pacificum TaxID=392723 RepID=UPI002157332B|nr:OstA-like protein [Marinoscillum pacificum]
MSKTLQYYTFLIILLMASPLVHAQKGKKIRYKAEGSLESGRRDGESYRKLVDKVVFTQENTTVYCDSSLFFSKRNVMEAFGHVKIVDDPAVITSVELLYEGDARMARLRKNVVYREGERRLYTDFLDYDLDGEIAHYFNGGKLIDSTNTLTSKIGYSFSKDNYAQFYTNVVLIAPDFTLKTDTLKYNTTTKVAYTYGPTEIIDNEGTTLHAKGGEFRTEYDESDFIEGNIETEDYYLEGDELYFDDQDRYYKAISNVKMTAKNDDVIIIGDEGFYDRKNGISKIFGRPVMKRIMEADTFYLTADTLVAIESEYDSAKRILAYPNIKIFKENLQGKADSMAYFISDSLLFFYTDPIMWNEQNQITADTISVEIKNEVLDKMNLMNDAFLVSEDTIKNCNQIKGREMITYFVDSEINHIDVNGNGEILYYALEEGDSLLMGMNKIFCARMQIRFKEQKLSSFSVYTKPEAKFIPPHELTDDVKYLAGYSWREEERPELFDVAYYLDPNYDAKSDSIRIKGTAPKKEKKQAPAPRNLPPSIEDRIKGNNNNARQTLQRSEADRPRSIKKDDGI